MYTPNPFNTYATYLPQTNSSHIVKVNGRGGAEAYQMTPNSQALLLDETQPIVWLKQTDGAGYPSLTAYDIKVHEETPIPDVKSLEVRISKIEEMLKNESNYSNHDGKFNGNGSSKTNGSNDKNSR